MKLQRLGILAGLALTATVALAACGTNDNNSGGTGTTTTGTGTSSAAATNCASGTVNASGSTAQANAIAEWIKDYTAQCTDAKINYNANGSGAGQTDFVNGTSDFAGSDSAMDAATQAQANTHCGSGNAAVHLPMVVGPVALVFNVSGVSNLQFKGATLADIFSGKITTWNDPEIAADNPGVSLPSTKITPVHRADSSGTTDNFTNYLATVAPSNWTYGHNKVWPQAISGGDAEQGSAGISQFLKSTDGAISYVEWSYVTLNNLNMAKIYNGAGQYQDLTAQSAGATIAGAKIIGTGDDLQMSIDYNTTASGAYPIVLVTYEIVCEKGTSAAALPVVKSFLTYASSTAGQNVLTSVGSAPLPESVRSQVAAVVAKIS